ncbi:cytochrome P450 [Streptomyces sp. NPDC000410]|uniref:cytochrome P450 n=1 Tax=Streptomyces sp. NPDC000410 TaxID=3154254 RepID=UPI00331DFDB0
MTPPTTSAPPPPLLPVGRLPLVGHTLALIRHRWDFTTEARGYGPVVGLKIGTRTAYLINDGELVHSLLVRGVTAIERSFLFTQFRNVLNESLITTEGPDHLWRRRALQPVFHRDRIRTYAESVCREAERRCAAWRDGATVRMDREVESYVLDTTCRLLFGPGTPADVPEVLRSSLQTFTLNAVVRAVLPPWAARLPTPWNRRYERGSHAVHSVVSRAVKAAAEASPGSESLLAHILALPAPGGGPALSGRQAHDEAIGLLIAGVETSRMAIAWLLELVARHPDVRTRVEAELDDVLAGRPLTAADLPRLTYARQVVDEALRLYSVWMVTRNATTDLDVAGVRIPAGSTVFFSPYAIHRDPRHFPDPERFDPSRWDPGRRAVARGAYQPFGAGAHRCIGEGLFGMSAVVLLATACSRRRFELPPGHVTRPAISGGIPATGPLPMTLTRRTAHRSADEFPSHEEMSG